LAPGSLPEPALARRERRARGGRWHCSTLPHATPLQRERVFVVNGLARAFCQRGIRHRWSPSRSPVLAPAQQLLAAHGWRRCLAKPPLPVHGTNAAVLQGSIVIAGGATRHAALSARWSDGVQLFRPAGPTGRPPICLAKPMKTPMYTGKMTLAGWGNIPLSARGEERSAARAAGFSAAGPPFSPPGGGVSVGPMSTTAQAKFGSLTTRKIWTRSLAHSAERVIY
jgi:hypothetical protein